MKTSEDQKKLDFLNKLLEKNPQIQKQFHEFMNDEEKEQLCDFDIEAYIREEAEDFTCELETLNFDDPDWEFYIPRHSGYIPEYEAREHIAEDMISEKFDDLNIGIEAHFSYAKNDLALLTLVGAYDACLKADIQDAYEALYDHEGFLLETLKVLQSTVIDKVQTMVISNRQAYCFSQGLFYHYKKRYPGNESFLRFFEPLLLSLIQEEKECVQYMEDLIKKNSIPRHFIPRLITEIYHIKGDRERWTEEAEHLFEHDVEVARNLLQYYIENSYDDFNRVSDRLWNADLFKHELASLMFEHINPESSPDLYKKILFWLTSHHRNISYYILLKNVLSNKEKEAFIDEHKHDHVFYTEMLLEEKRYREVLQFIRKNLDSWSFNEMITTILEPFPEESFEILKNKTLKTVETQRGRNVYKRIVEWLQLAQSIKNMEKRTDDLVMQLYHWQPRLPALRDELKNGGLIKK